MKKNLPRILLFGLLVGMAGSLLGGLDRLHPLSPRLELFRSYHGPLLCASVLPGLIGLERAVAIGRRWAWAPTATALLSLPVVLLVGRVATPLLLATALGLFAQQVYLWWRRPGLDGQLAALAPLALAAANASWGLGASAPSCALGWSSFLILVIAAERLELSFLFRSSSRVLPLAALLPLVGLLTAQPRILGAGWLLMALWLGRNDLARRNAWRHGLTAYSARCVLLGYAWLAASGLQLLWSGLPLLAGPSFDRTLHGVFVGFVLSMIMAHGPIIFPAICKSAMAFSPWFYLPVTVLHASLLVRCLGWTSWGAMGNLAAMLGFAACMLAHARGGHNPWLLDLNHTLPSSAPSR